MIHALCCTVLTCGKLCNLFLRVCKSHPFLSHLPITTFHLKYEDSLINWPLEPGVCITPLPDYFWLTLSATTCLSHQASAACGNSNLGVCRPHPPRKWPTLPFCHSLVITSNLKYHQLLWLGSVYPTSRILSTNPNGHSLFVIHNMIYAPYIFPWTLFSHHLPHEIQTPTPIKNIKTWTPFTGKSWF